MGAYSDITTRLTKVGNEHRGAMEGLLLTVHPFRARLAEHLGVDESRIEATSHDGDDISVPKIGRLDGSHSLNVLDFMLRIQFSAGESGPIVAPVQVSFRAGKAGISVSLDSGDERLCGQILGPMNTFEWQAVFVEVETTLDRWTRSVEAQLGL